MMNFTTNTTSNGQNFCIEDDLKAIFKAGLRKYSVGTLSLYLECLVEVINEKREAERKNLNGENRID